MGPERKPASCLSVGPWLVFELFFKSIHFERERKREREEERNRLYAVSSEPDTGLELTNPEIMPELKSGVGCLTD